MDFVTLWLADRLKIEPDTIERYEFLASESYEYSEYTAEGFSCDIYVFLKDGDKRFVGMGELDTVEFLNSFWKSVIPIGNKE